VAHRNVVGRAKLDVLIAPVGLVQLQTIASHAQAAHMMAPQTAEVYSIAKVVGSCNMCIDQPFT